MRVNIGCTHAGRLGRPSRRTAEVGMRFGIPLYPEPVHVIEPSQIEIRPGRIILLLGPSGSGKTSALAQVERRFSGGCMVERVAFPPGVAVVDRVAEGGELSEALNLLTCCGLGEPHLWVRAFNELSEGERFRARLARAIGLHARSPSAAPLLCDEFCSNLHRRAAKSISYNLRKLATRLGLSLVLAASNDDIVRDLRPDVLVRLGDGSACEVQGRDVSGDRAISFLRRLKIEVGCKRDYNTFASMHYRATDELGFVSKVFVLRDGASGEPLGIVVYAHSPLELALRNRATNGRFTRNPKLVNRSFRILRRLVIHRDVRGCGLGHHLVRKTLPAVGTPYVECLAGMGAFNPVFEKAGMTAIGQYDLPPKRQAALDELHEMDVDPNGRAFVTHVCRRRRVRMIVEREVYAWYQATTGGGRRRVEHQSPQLLAQTFRSLIASQPVYYLWQRPAATANRKRSAQRKTTATARRNRSTAKTG